LTTAVGETVLRQLQEPGKISIAWKREQASFKREGLGSVRMREREEW